MSLRKKHPNHNSFKLPARSPYIVRREAIGREPGRMRERLRWNIVEHGLARGWSRESKLIGLCLIELISFTYKPKAQPKSGKEAECVVTL